MAEARFEIAIGNIRFSSEGTEEWVDKKYEAFLDRLEQLRDFAPPQMETNSGTTTPTRDDSALVAPLAIFLKQKNVGDNQNNRFLAAAVWLKRNGQASMKIADVTKALADAQQKRLGNPSEIFSRNVQKGYCVKTSDGFYVTPEGEEALGK